MRFIVRPPGLRLEPLSTSEPRLLLVMNANPLEMLRVIFSALPLQMLLVLDIRLSSKQTAPTGKTAGPVRDSRSEGCI